MRAIYKILHTTCHTGWGGLERRIFNESVWMEKNGHTVVIVAPKDTPLFQKAKDHGFKVYAVEFKRLGIFGDYQFLKQIFTNEQPDVVNTHGNKDTKIALLAAKKTDIPLRILSRHISAHVSNSWYNRLLYKHLCHYIFTTADYTTNHLKQVFKLKDMRIFSMPSGIEIPETLLDRQEARKSLAKRFDLDPETRFIGFVGRVSKDKGVSSILEAFKIISHKLVGTHVVIVGGGTDEYLQYLKKLASDLGIHDRVHFTGFQENVWQFYRALDCKILPSKNVKGIPFEGVPQSLLEAMACECPVIGSKSGGIMDIIDHEKTGLLFNALDVSDLADKILQTLKQDEAVQMRIETARKKVQKHHTIDAMGKNIIRIYRLHQVRLDRYTY
ncbi:MAG: glycosyltransferase family 4 protein [Pseudomonadota bacterium]